MICLSSNSKTGESTNWDKRTCRPTRQCQRICYFTFRTWDIIKRNGWVGSTLPNTGPITRPIAQQAYKRNTDIVTAAADTPALDMLAVDLAARMRVLPHRGCGGGDLTPAIAKFYAKVAAQHRALYLYSRKADMICYLAERLEELGLERSMWPHVIGSVDVTTPDVADLIDATRKINGSPALAFSTGLDGYIPETASWFKHVDVVFGFHAGSHKTHTGHCKACPSTEGNKITCQTCRKCFGRFMHVDSHYRTV